MRHSLYKYYSNRKWAEAFLDGQILFRSLSYFLDYEDKNARRDQNEGTSVYRPEGGLVINNLTQGTTFTLPRHAFLSKAKQEEIFVFCASRSPSDEHREKFDAAVCVEILVIKTLCDRIEAALPPGATFRGQRVKYYQEAEGGNPRWALPDKIATSKLVSYAWQDEYRLLFCLTDALEFENVELRLVQDNARDHPKRVEHREYLLHVRSLRDICRLHEF
jgi:hypothetical protein